MQGKGYYFVDNSDFYVFRKLPSKTLDKNTIYRLLLVHG